MKRKKFSKEAALASVLLFLPILPMHIFGGECLPFSDFPSDTPNRLSLWYDKPATEWVEALPIGNGRLGGMVFGKTDYERIQLNEESMWSGSRTVTDKPDAYKYLPQVRRLLFDEKYAEAQTITERDMMAEGTWNMYQTLGDSY